MIFLLDYHLLYVNKNFFLEAQYGQRTDITLVITKAVIFTRIVGYWVLTMKLLINISAFYMPNDFQHCSIDVSMNLFVQKEV
jgi:hypothetical protein